MIKIEYLSEKDRGFWFSLDKHLPESEFLNKIRDKNAYVIFEDEVPVGILRYNLFWDNTPFCNLIYIKDEFQRKGYGKILMEHFEKEMRSKGYSMLMTSTQANEEAQHFYRKLGYIDAGGFVIRTKNYTEPMELIFIKEIE